MTFLRETAKAWVGGVGAAVTTYVGLWTEDPRVIGLAAVISAFAVWLVPNKPVTT